MLILEGWINQPIGRGDNLLNIKKTATIQAKVSLKPKLSKSLTNKTNFLCLYVSKPLFSKSNQLNIH